MGDMNARCGNEADIVTIIDKDIPDRVSIDDTKNSRSSVFLDFLKSVNYCMLNGRITPDLNNFTCISHKGRSVVDYLFVRHESISNINQFSVLTVTDLCQSLNIQAARAMPEHSILSANVIVRHTVETQSPGSNDKVLENSQVHVLNERMHLKHKCNNMPSNFMNNDETLMEVNRMIDYLEMHEVCQENIDTLYEDICQIYYNKMDDKLKYFDNRNTKQTRRTLKPWWNEMLSNLFNDYRKAEKMYLKCNYRLEKSRLLANFKSKRSIFDREYRKAKRAYDEEIKIGIAEDETKNPKEFWYKIKTLGRGKVKPSIPNKVKLEDGQISFDQTEVLNKWKNDFSTLYNEDTLDDANLNSFQTNSSENYEQVDNLNDPITIDECKRVISLTKSRKAVEIDCLPN